ncbi:MAG: class I SAM-dependent methyltransferase [Caldilineaceae bacterium]
MSNAKQQDIWYEWLLRRRDGNDPARSKATRDFLAPVRNKVLENARFVEGETLLDVGCGDGLIALRALEQTRNSKVIFLDISQDLLDHAKETVIWSGDLFRSQFIRASADDLAQIPSETVNVVTTRSVLIYVANKQKSFCEFLRVLKPGGRLSIFEPISRFGSPEPTQQFWGYDVAPVQEIAQKVLAVYRRIQPLDSDPMLDFDERDLFNFAVQAGFSSIALEYQASLDLKSQPQPWATLLNTARNPRIPTLKEAMEQCLSPDEIERFSAHLRPLVESGQGRSRFARAYLTAVKG